MMDETVGDVQSGSGPEAAPAPPRARRTARRSPWKHRAEYYLARGLQALVGALPERMAGQVGRGAGALAHSPLGLRRDVVRANLRRAFPDASEAWLERTARASFRHLGREAATLLRLGRLDAGAIRERTQIEGWEALQEALAEGRGAVLVSGHFGNWEVAAAAVAVRGVPFEAVAQRLHNDRVEERLVELRRRFGVATIDRRVAPQRVPRALRAGHAVGMVPDQDARAAGVWVPFFGHLASTHRGPALFALRLGAPLFTIFARRLPGSPVCYQIDLERLPVRRTGRMEADILRLTYELNARLEDVIRTDPEQYFWFHRRWKSSPPAELPPELFGTTSRQTESDS